LLGMRSRSDAEIEIRLGQLEIPKEDLGHRLIIVLSRVHDQMPDAAGMLLKCLMQRGNLHEIRPGPDDANDGLQAG
jgi:hypothetical protein